MKKLICILTLFYYSIGSLLLPASNFSISPELPQMFSHCKATEDKDMNFVDFLTDHLINIDGIFDHHEASDEQKPHQPMEVRTIGPIAFIPSNFFCQFELTAIPSSEINHFKESNYHYDFFGDLFRPPIV